MCFYPVFALKIDRSSFELCLHDPEAFFDFPTLFVYPDYLVDSHVVEVCTNSIEAIIFTLLEEGEDYLNDIGADNRSGLEMSER